MVSWGRACAPPKHGVGGWGSSCRTHTCCQKGPEIVGSHRRTDAHQARLHKAKRQTVYMRQHQGQRAGVEQRIARTGADIGTTVAPRRLARAGTVRLCDPEVSRFTGTRTSFRK